jgi:uncharacterized RDD family membrane protein YckC
VYDYPDPAMPGSVGTYANRPKAASQPQQWRRGYMAAAKLASWPWRLASGAIDYVPLILIVDFFSSMHVVVLGFLITAVLILANSVYMQGTTGQSLGKRIVGTRLVSAIDTGPFEFTFVYPGIGRCLGRQLAHGVDLIVFYLGFIRPLWQREHRTWADSIAKTVVLDRRSASEHQISPREPGQVTTRCL